MSSKIYRLSILLSILLIGCNSEENDNLSYHSCLDKLIMNYASLGDISVYTELPSHFLIEEKLKTDSVSPELTKTLNEILNLFSKDYNEGQKHILEQKSNITYKLKQESIHINVNELKEQERLLNEEFQNVIYNIASDYIIKGVEDTFSKKYSLLNIPRNIWLYFTTTDERRAINFQELLNNNLQMKELNLILNQRVEAYTHMLNLQHHIAGDTLPSKVGNIKIMLEDYKLNLEGNEEFVALLNARDKKEMKSLFVDLIISTIISIIIASFMVFLGSLLVTISRNVSKYIKLLISIAIFVLCIYFFDYKSIEDELLLENIIYANYADYLEKQNLNILDLLNSYIN